MESFELRGVQKSKTGLEKIIDDDQLDREGSLDKINPELFSERERDRYQRLLEIFAQYDQRSQDFSPKDLYHLAFLFHHGSTSEDYRRAHMLALEAERQGSEDAKWLTAATEDRYLLSLGKKQKWGTQFVPTEDGSQRLAPMEDDAISRITNKMRQSKNVPLRK